MVSPPDKNGQDVLPALDTRSGTPRGLPSGNAIVYAARGSFAGNPSNPLAPTYLSVRGESSWSTRGITPPVRANTQAASRLSQVSEDLSVLAVQSNEALAPGAWSADFGCCDGEALYVRDLVSDSYQLLTPEPAPGGAGGREGPTPYFSFFMRGDADLSHSLFETTAELTPEAVPLADTAFKLYKCVVTGAACSWTNGTLTLESVLPDPDGPGPAEGAAASGSAGGGLTGRFEWMNGAISDDGSRVFFSSPTGAGPRPLYVRENGVTTQIHASATFRGASDDGSKVFFTAPEPPPRPQNQIALQSYDVDSQTFTTLSVDNEPLGGTSNAALGLIDFSDDGSRVYFAASSQLVPGEDTASGNKLYVWDNGVVKFIARSSFSAGFNTFMWGTNSLLKEPNMYVTPNGAAFMFLSREQLTGYDNSNPDCASQACQEAFVYSADSGQIVCVSCNPSGAPPVDDTGTGTGSGDSGLGVATRHLSDDGSRAFFGSPDPLVPEDVNGEQDVYMWEDGELQLISTGRHSEFSAFAYATPSGDDVFFTTAERLSAWDRDDSQDMYDARVGGGLPEPPPPPPVCVGDECQGQPSRPALIAPGTSPFRGSGDLVLRPRPSFRIMRVSRAQRSRLARTGRIALGVRVNRAGRVAAAAKSKLGERTRSVARGSKAARDAGTVKVPLRLSKAARRELARDGRLLVRVAVRFARVREAKNLTLRLRRAVAPASGKGR
jgi:hypothetical protein